MTRWRHEYKYLIDTYQKTILLIRLNGLLEKDAHCNKDGNYIIRSLYFDTLDDLCLKANINGEDNRSKYRIRYYERNNKNLFLEKKSKLDGFCYKESVPITLKEYKSIIEGKNLPINSKCDPVKVKLFNELKMFGLRPKTIVTYKRTVFVNNIGNVRITFDEDITSSNDIDLFLKGGYSHRPIFEKDTLLLEVKYDELMPKYIYEALSLDNCTWTAFSKYFETRLLPTDWRN